jgi:hypothetical protein
MIYIASNINRFLLDSAFIIDIRTVLVYNGAGTICSI